MKKRVGTSKNKNNPENVNKLKNNYLHFLNFIQLFIT